MMLFKRRPAVLMSAFQAEMPGEYKGHFYTAGDYVVDRMDGSVAICPKDIFEKLYEPASDEDVHHVKASAKRS